MECMHIASDVPTLKAHMDYISLNMVARTNTTHHSDENTNKVVTYHWHVDETGMTTFLFINVRTFDFDKGTNINGPIR
eukprot:13183460-Heterocapsa_arctica.AAC.1